MIPVPILFWRIDAGKPLDGVLLVLRGMRMVVSQLFERDVSADKIHEPANSFILLLNDIE